MYGNIEVEFMCADKTTELYEQAFYNDDSPKVTGDIIADVFGRQRAGGNSFVERDEDGNVTAIVIDYTCDNWNAEIRALWAMAKTQDLYNRAHGGKPLDIPSYESWRAQFEWEETDRRTMSHAILEELNRGLFLAGAAASE